MTMSANEKERDVVNVAEINPYAPAPCTFTEAALSLRDSIRAAGYGSSVHVNRTDVQQRCIVLGALPPHLPAVEQLDRRRAVVFNLKPLAGEPNAAGSPYVSWLRQWLVADYHAVNLEWLRNESAGAQRALELPIVPGRSIAFRPDLPYEPSVDVLFYGSPSARRTALLERLRQAGMTVEEVTGVFAHELAPAIKRARLVLHVHYDETALFPLARVLQPVAQGVPIACEASVFSPLADWSRSGIVFAPYDELVEACRTLLRSRDERDARAKANSDFAAGIDFATPLERMLRMLDDMKPVATRAPIASPASAAVPSPAAPAAPTAPAAPAWIAPVASFTPSALDGRSRIVLEGEEAQEGGKADVSSAAEEAQAQPLSNEEIEAILAREGHELPPESHVTPPAVRMVERQPGQGRFGAWIVWLLIVFSAYTIWQGLAPLLK
ncbi:MAG TPA: hypothetical protein VHA82_02580 [Ramlibacter sp.]|uniref:glycosyltransferase family protein n=1 Tax=Ramlibacter sp. TaxID=1917967 RepID=UPI002B57CA5F|nr:hypothetical protein [Ramlibacter sp.]HVZ42669.1 hypothetical protein [Ramlibacter sp.]